MTTLRAHVLRVRYARRIANTTEIKVIESLIRFRPDVHYFIYSPAAALFTSYCVDVKTASAERDASFRIAFLDCVHARRTVLFCGDV